MSDCIDLYIEYTQAEEKCSLPKRALQNRALDCVSSDLTQLATTEIEALYSRHHDALPLTVLPERRRVDLGLVPSIS